ncbi:MAG: hypothetical protein GEV07_12910 [Streptosporangiales bacterium]|nr:hypothetical protein [Streptosporangiales bacterium]
MRQPEHREITRRAVAELFRAHPSVRMGALSEGGYFQAVNRAQAYQDRPFDRRTLLGPTLHPGTWNPGVQRAHALADPRRSGADNLGLVKEYVLAELLAATAGGRAEMVHLGAAVHAVQDSYSGAHTWRGDAVYGGDPNAPVQSLNVFHPVLRDTHDQRFDRPPLESGTVSAAVRATTELLAVYEFDRAAGGSSGLHQLIDRLFQPDTRGVGVNLRAGRAWQQERDRRLGLESHFRTADDQQVHFPRARIERSRRSNRLSRDRRPRPRDHDPSREHDREP